MIKKIIGGIVLLIACYLFFVLGGWGFGYGDNLASAQMYCDNDKLYHLLYGKLRSICFGVKVVDGGWWGIWASDRLFEFSWISGVFLGASIMSLFWFFQLLFGGKKEEGEEE